MQTMKKRLTLSQKISRLRFRLHDREWRRYGRLLLIGKVMGIALLVASVTFLPDLIGLRALAADGDVKPNDIVNPLNTVWTLVAAFLVFGMQVGFTMLEAGFCRSRETVNVLMECIVDTCLCGLLFFAFGFAFMFSHGNGFIGYHWFFLQGAPATYESDWGSVPGVLVVSVCLRRHLLDDHLGRDDRAHRLRRRSDL